MLDTFTLSNGLKIATYNMPELRSVQIRINVKAGSLLEDRKTSGRAHFLEHMLVQGIPSFPTVDKLAEHIEGLAGNYSASTSQTITDFYIALPSVYLEEAVKITSEVFFAPLFPQDALEEDKIRMPEEYIELIKDTKPIDILELVQRYWEVDKAKLIIQGPISNSLKNKERYKKILNILVPGEGVEPTRG